jgi:hypothetical protein
MWANYVCFRFIAFVPGVIDAVEEGLKDTVVFVREKMGA